MMDALDSDRRRLQRPRGQPGPRPAETDASLGPTGRDEMKIRAAKALFGSEGAGTDEHSFRALDEIRRRLRQGAAETS
jgi:hypothetical protein